MNLNQVTLAVSRIECVQPSRSLIYFECDALDATAQRLQALGVQFSMRPTDQPWFGVRPT